jgi:hypothetical protein
MGRPPFYHNGRHPLAPPISHVALEMSAPKDRDGEDGCGNDVPMETRKRFPQGLGNLAQNGEIPTFPQADHCLVLQQKREKRRRSAASQTALSDPLFPDWENPSRSIGGITD